MIRNGEKWVPIGRIGRAQGLKGLVRVQMFNPASDLFARVETIGVADPEGTSLSEWTIQESAPHGRWMLLKFKGISTREDAVEVRDRVIYARRADFPQAAPGEYYCCDLIGLPVETSAGRPLGVLRDIMPTASNDVYVVEGEEGEVLLPALPDVILKIDLSHGRIVARPPEVVDAI